MKRPRLLLLCLALTAALLALAVALRPWYAQVVAEHWRAQLKTVPDQRAEILLRKVAALGEPGIPVLVEALGSQRESVARAANRLLTQRLDSWQRSSEEEDERHQAILVEALAEQVGGFGPTAQRNAARLATRVLQWLPDPKVVDRSHVIACCERVFRATEASGGLPSDEQLAAWSMPQEEEAASGADRLRPDDPGEAAASIARLGPLPGGGLPVPLFSEPQRQPEALEPSPLADADAERPRRLSALPIARLLNPLCQPDALSHAPEEVVRGPSLTVPAVEQPSTELSPLRSLRASEPGNGAPLGSAREVTRMETLEVMRLLQAEDEGTVAAARAELGRRGFRTVHFDLARRLFDPDPQVRRRLAVVLPRLRRVDPAPWLLALCRDPAAEVRLAAVTAAASLGKPDLLEQVEQLAGQDPDPRIRHQAARLAGRREGPVPH